MRKLRLAIIRQNYRIDGGAERFIVEMLKTLDTKIFELNIITRSLIYKNNYNVNVHICNPKKYGKISREFFFANAARNLWKKEKFDIVQSHERISGCDIFRAGDGVHRSWIEKRKKILNCFIKKMIINISPYHRYILYAEEKMFNSYNLKAVICNSKMICKEILHYFKIDTDKIHLIYNSINTLIFHPANEYERYISRKKLKLPQNKIVFIYVGSGFYRKGLKYAIQSIAGMDKYLIIVGNDKNFYFYKKLAENLNCFNKMRFVGKQKNIQSFYFAADALLLPTLYDPCPNVVLEAMACGLAIITTNNCGGAEFIEEGKEGFICSPFNIKKLKEIIEAINLITINPIMGQKARKKIKIYNQQYLDKKLKELYYKVVKL